MSRAPKSVDQSPHIVRSLQSERDSYANIALRYKVGTLDRWMADERVKQLDIQIARYMAKPEERPQQEAFRATGIPGGDDKAYGA